ncbi:MAG: motif family protein [Gemmatimonadetes bacterium]|nr:motif family protein [Gemmatimonadota bacterium]
MRAVRGMLAVVVGLTMAGASLAAQQGGPGASGMGRMGLPNLEELSARLNLTADQQTRVKALITRFESDTKGVRETLMKNRQAVQSGADPASFRDENMAAMMLLREDANKLNVDVRALLTPQQQVTYDQYLEEQRARMRQGRPGGPPPTR